MLPKLIVFPPKCLPYRTHSSETFLGKHTKRPLLPQSKERYAASKSKSTAILSATNCGSIPDDISFSLMEFSTTGISKA